MGWQFLSVDDRRQLTDELAELGLIQLGPTSRSALLNQAGLADLISRLDSLGNSSAQVFAAELVSTLENETTLPEQPHHQALGLLLDYVLSQSDTPQSTREVCARIIGRYRLIDDEAVLAKLAAEYGAPQVVTPWRDSRRLPAMQRLNRLMVVAVVGALALLAVTAAVAWSRRPTLGPSVTGFAVALSITESCSEDWSQDLADGIDATVKAAMPERPITFDGEPDKADLVLTLSCEGDDVIWEAQFARPAPIFEIVGSPQEFSLRLPSPDQQDLARLGRALIYYGRNDFTLAEESFSRLVAAFDAPELQWLYANTLLLTEQYEPAVAALSDLIDVAEGDMLALAYTNRALAHLDEKYRQETDRAKTRQAMRLALEDIERALALPLVAPHVVALIHSDFGVMKAMLSDPDVNLDQAAEACKTADNSRAQYAWAQVCKAVVLMEPRKFHGLDCDEDFYVGVLFLLDTAEQWRPELGATYYWQMDALYQYTKACKLQAEVEDFQTRCVKQEQWLNSLREAGLAPLFLHTYLIGKFPDCTL